ncbi:DUF452 family protein [Labilibacter sediminis]|nr:DUF452 family protein [Labilibacter sediminis]
MKLLLISKVKIVTLVHKSLQMQFTWIQQHTSNKLIIFFNGWGCDHHQFKHLTSKGFDVLMISDYKSLALSQDICDAIKQYQEIDVVAWSYGVWIAQYVCEKESIPVNLTVAINGTIKPVHGQFGIPEAIMLGTLKNLSERNIKKFQRRMVGGNEAWKSFEADKSQRTFEELQEELAALVNHFKLELNNTDFYQKAVVGSEDLIFTSANQLAFWQDKAEVKIMEVPHFCFYEFSCWDELLMLS